MYAFGDFHGLDRFHAVLDFKVIHVLAISFMVYIGFDGFRVVYGFESITWLSCF